MIQGHTWAQCIKRYDVLSQDLEATRYKFEDFWSLSGNLTCSAAPFPRRLLSFRAIFIKIIIIKTVSRHRDFAGSCDETFHRLVNKGTRMCQKWWSAWFLVICYFTIQCSGQKKNKQKMFLFVAWWYYFARACACECMYACASVLRRVSVVSRRRSIWEEDPAKNTESVGFPGFVSRRFCSIVKTWYECCITCHGYPGYSREPHWKSMGLPEISSVTWKAWICLISRTGSMSLPGP